VLDFNENRFKSGFGSEDISEITSVSAGTSADRTEKP
jgi:hypothetical protein